MHGNQDSLFFFSGYRYLPDMDEAGCRVSCLLEDTCLAVQYSTETGGCKLLDKKSTLVAEDKPTSKIIVFLTRLQRERETLVFGNLKVKTDQLPRLSQKAGNITQCNESCSQDAFCAAFVFCFPYAGGWCETMNCLLYSEKQVAAVEIDESGKSLMFFVWKNYDLVKDNGGDQQDRRKRRVVQDERKDM